MIQHYPKSVSVELILKNLHDHAALFISKRDKAEIESISMDEIRNLTDIAWKTKPPLDALATARIGHRPEITVSFDVHGNIDTHEFDELYGENETATAISKAKKGCDASQIYCKAKTIGIGLLMFILMNVKVVFGSSAVIDGVTWWHASGSIENRGNWDKQNPWCNAAVASVPSSGIVECPSNLNGVAISAIGPLAFWGCTNIACLSIPANIKTIHRTAFARDLKYAEGRSHLGLEGRYYIHYATKGGAVRNLYFQGAKPNVSESKLIDPSADIGRIDGVSSYYYAGSYYSTTGYSENWVYGIQEGVLPLEDVTCWVEMGAVGWDTTITWYGATVQYAPGAVTITPDAAAAETVALSSVNPNAILFYTLDGSTPTPNETSNCHRYNGSFSITSNKTTIRAISYVDGCPLTPSVQRTYNSLGTVDSPIIASEMGIEFYYSGNLITLGTESVGATIRYTTDGSHVTGNSPIYTAPFEISETTTVRAKAFKEDWFDSEEAVQTFTRLWYTNETPVVSAAAETFDTTSQEVTLSCDTEGATIYYTIDGSEPSATNGRIYKGPFDIYQTTTVKAIAVKDDWKDSVVASATFTKANAIGPAINMLEVLPDNDKTHPWEVVSDVTHDGVSAVKSGEIEDDESTTLKVTVYGAGELSFWWKTSCEPSIDGGYYDYATFYNGSTAVTNLAGETDWQQVRLNVAGTGKHTFKWTYQKDDSNSTVPDGVWLDQVQWLPTTTDYYSDHTLTTETPVKYNWLRQYGLGVTTDFESAAKAMSGKCDGAGRALRVEDEFVAGTDPTNETSRLKAFVDMSEGFPKVTWDPDLNEDGTKGIRTYKIWGKETLDASSEWEYPTNSLHHFFKVTVEMP